MATRKRKSGIIFFLLALLLIIILAVIAFFMRDQLIAMFIPQQETAEEIPVVPTPVMYDIVVVIQPVDRGAALTEAMLGTVSYPQESMVEGLFYTEIVDVVGKRAKIDLEPGMVLTPAMLSESSVGSFISFEIPPGMVAISIPIPSERYAVSYALKPGDHVNILGGLQIVDMDQDFQTALPNEIATLYKNEIFYGESPVNLIVDYTLRIDGSNVLGRVYQDPSIPDEFFYIVPGGEQKPRWITQMVVQNAMVLWVGDMPLEEETQQETTETTETGEAAEAQPQDEYIPEPRRITVAVSSQDAVALNYLILSEADLNFVLRSAGDEQLIQTEPVTMQYIMDQYNIPYPAKLPYGIDMSSGNTPVEDFAE